MRVITCSGFIALLAALAPKPALAQPADAHQATASASAIDQQPTPPEVLEAVDPVYPDRALSEQRTGEVILLLDIDEAGTVTQSQVAKAAGYGMDEAAQAASLRLKFRPAMRGSQRIRSRIAYKMSFDLRPAEPTQPASSTPPVAASSATIHGFVRLEDTEMPCAGATVELRTAQGLVLRTATDENGGWRFADVPPGAGIITVTSSGFKPLLSHEAFVAGEDVAFTYRVHTDDGSLEVLVHGERPDREVTRRTVERQELAVVPGTSGDALKVVQALPGVARTPVFSGMIVVRGSSPYGTQTFIDGTFVPAIYHFGGLSSIVPTESIESLDFYPGNFSAKYGRATGGIIDVKLRELDPKEGYHGLAQVDFIDARLMLRGPVPFAKKWAFSVAGRRSHIDAWIGAVMSKDASFQTAPVYYDFQAFAETKPTPKSMFRIGVFGSDDRLQMVLKNSIESDPGVGNSIKGELRTMRLMVTYRNQITDALGVNATASVGLDREFQQVGSVSNVDANYIPLILRGDVNYRLSDQFLVRAGPDIVVYRYNADVLSMRPPEPGEMDASHANRPMLRYNDNGYFSGPAAFAELEWTPSSRAKLLFGGRVDYFSLTNKTDVSPRFNARYDLHAGKHRTTVKAGVGVFYEPPQIIQAITPFGTPDLLSNRSVHSSLGLEQVVTPEVDVSVEAFHKYLDNLIVAAQNADGSNGFSNLGKGYAYGTETMVRWKPGGRFFGWVAYTLSRSVRKNNPNQPQHLYDFDQTHNLTLLGSYDVGRGWRLGGRFRYVTGNPYTPCEGGVLNAAAGTYDCIQGQQSSRRIPAFHQLDVRVDKTWKFQDFQLTAYLDVQNAYNRSNAEGVAYNYRYTTNQWQTGLPIIPSLGVKGEF